VKEIGIGEYIAKKKLSNLLNLWVKGLDFDWTKLYGEVKPQRISLPTYPFAKERYWIETTETVEVVKTRNTASLLHPLLHRNTSDLKQHRYTSTFTGAESFLTSHQVSSKEKGPRSKIQRISLPTYAFAKERCWVDSAQVIQSSENSNRISDPGSLEDIINKIESDSMGTSEAVKLIRHVTARTR
jgi:acyl transferase domain-containing protein